MDQAVGRLTDSCGPLRPSNGGMTGPLVAVGPAVVAAKRVYVGIMVVKTGYRSGRGGRARGRPRVGVASVESKRRVEKVEEEEEEEEESFHQLEAFTSSSAHHGTHVCSLVSRVERESWG